MARRQARRRLMSETDLLKRITVNPRIFGGKPIVRGRRLAVEHVLGMLVAGDTAQSLLTAYSWLELEDIQACLLYARKVVAEERVEPLIIEAAT
jgi:uncharacterized protein (DUF433 family)